MYLYVFAVVLSNLAFCSMLVIIIFPILAIFNQICYKLVIFALILSHWNGAAAFQLQPMMYLMMAIYITQLSQKDVRKRKHTKIIMRVACLIFWRPENIKFWSLIRLNLISYFVMGGHDVLTGFIECFVTTISV